MSEFLPHYKRSSPVSFTASAAIVGGQLCEITGNMTVGPAGALSTKVVGVAARDASASGVQLPVYPDGDCDLVAAGAIAAGALVVAAANGTVQTIGANVFGTVVGRALEAIADTAKGRIRLGAL